MAYGPALCVPRHEHISQRANIAQRILSPVLPAAGIAIDTQTKMANIIDWAMKYGRLTMALMPVLAASALMLSCSEADDPTSGHVVVAGSESVWRAMDTEAREFMAMYGKATARAVGVGSNVGLKLMF